jgi:peptidoglycan DL-endopeptidase LytE
MDSRYLLMQIKDCPIHPTAAALLFTMLTAFSLPAASQNPVPPPDPTKSPVTAVSPRQQPSHIVQEGDNLWNLARRYQTTVDELQEINGLKNDRLQLGQQLLLPSSAVAPSSAATAMTHTVREGDNLWELARHYHTSVAELLELNRLPNNRLRLGQLLRIPGPPEAELPDLLKRRPAVAVSRDGNTAATEIPGEGLAALVEQAIALRDTSDQQLGRSMVAGSEGDPGQGKEPSAATAPQPLTLREQLVVAGFNFLGVRYRWNGTSEKRGFDCSGLVQRLYSLFSIEVPRSSREQFKVGEKIARAALEIGDLVFFSTRGGKIPSHVGIYIGADQFLHAASRSKQVMISKLTEEWYSRRFIGARRIQDLWKDENRIAEGKGN